MGIMRPEYPPQILLESCTSDIPGSYQGSFIMIMHAVSVLARDAEENELETCKPSFT